MLAGFLMKNKSSFILLLLLSISLLGYNYIDNHYGELMSFLADYHFKHNNISKAQEYYEKAFELGINNYKQRDTYVNSIINSPLTTDAQEKLVKFLENPKDDVARKKVEYFLYDFKREIRRKYPENYITNAIYNQNIIRWGSSPITYSFVNKEDVPNYFIREIENAFTEWEIATDHQILFSEEDKNPNIIIVFDLHNPAENDDKKHIVAYTTPSLNLNHLKNMKIVFYLKDPQGNNFSQNQVYSTALHEIVHALGFMGHSDNKDNVMYLTKDSMSVIKDERETLTEADINTVKLLYKIKPQISNTENVKGDYIPYMVMGSEDEINNEKIREAKFYIKKAPNLPAGYIDLAEGYVIAKDYKKAVKSLEKALALADNNEFRSMIYNNLAITYFHLDNMYKAKEYLNLSMQINDTEEKHYLLAEIYVREGKNTKAVKEYSQLINKNPKNIEYTIALINLYIINKNYTRARAVLKNYIKNNPSEKNNPRFEPYGVLKLGL